MCFVAAGPAAVAVGPTIMTSVGAYTLPAAVGAASSAAATAATVSTVATVASSAISALGMYAQGQQSSAVAKANAKIAEANAEVADKKARNAEYQGVLERQRISMDEEAMRGTGRTSYAAGNVQLGSGSPVSWEVDLTERANADKRMSKYNADVAAWGERVSANSSRYQAGLYRSSASNLATSGMLGAGGSLLAGASTVADKYYRYTYR